MNVDIEAHREEYEAEQAAAAAARAAVVAANLASEAAAQRQIVYDRNVKRLAELATETARYRDHKLKTWMQPAYDYLKLSLGTNSVELRYSSDPVPLSTFLDLLPGEVEHHGVSHKVALIVKGIDVSGFVSEQEEWSTGKYSSKRNGRTRLKIATGYTRPTSSGRHEQVVEVIHQRKDGGRDWQKLAEAIVTRVDREIMIAKRAAMAKKNSAIVAEIKEKFAITDYSTAVAPSTDVEGKVVINLKEWYVNNIRVDASDACDIIDKLMAMGFKPSYTNTLG